MIGDPDNMIQRQKAVLPRWFSDVSPVLDGVLMGFASVASLAWDQIGYTKLQTRIATATGGWIDIIAYDYFGRRVRRKPGQSDPSFRQTVIDEIVRERVTRRGIQKAVEDLTGNPVRIIEPWNPSDCGGWDTGYLGYDMVGRWGSLDLPYQLFLACLNPIGAGIPNAPGFDDGHGGLDVPPLQWGDLSRVSGPVTHQDIYDTINATRAAGVTVWTAIGYPPEAHLDDDFALDVSELV